MRLVPSLRLRLPRILGLLSTIFLSMVSLTRTASGQSSSPPPPPPQPASADQEQFISYWTTETGWRSELELRNNTTSDLTVTPALRTANGVETALGPVTIHPQEIRIIDLESAAIDGRAPQYVGTYGSVILRYRSPSQGSLFPMVMIHNIGHSIAYHIDSTGEEQDVKPGSLEGIWWLPNETATDYLLLTNLGSAPLPVDLSLYDSTGHEAKQKVALDAKTTNRLSVRQLILATGLSGTFGGIKIFAPAHEGSLTSLHLVFDEKASFSALLKMFDYDPSTKLEERDYAHTNAWTLRAPMLALSHPDPALAFPEGTVLRPQLFVRNAVAKPVNISLRFNWRNASASGKAAGPAFRLGPFETRRIDVGALQTSNILPKNAYWASVVLTTSGLPDEVVAVAASYDEALRYGAQTPFSDQLAFHWVGSLWEYDAQHDSLITAGNGGTKPVKAALTIHYNQGTQKYELEQSLQPDEQMWIDVGKIIREHVPDKNGNVLPADLTSGSYEIRDLTDKFIGNLFEGKIVYDKTYGHVTYGCGGCCGYTQTKLWYDPLGVPLSSSAGSGVFAYTTCSQSWDDVSNVFDGTWSTANTSIATVDYYAKHSGVAVGSTTSAAAGTLEHATQKGQTCPLLRFNPGGGVNVASASIAVVSTGPVPQDNGAKISYASYSGTTNLGPYTQPDGSQAPGCNMGFETVGYLNPSVYTGFVTLHRQLIGYTVSKGSSLIITKGSKDDTSLSEYRDDDPQSGGSAGKVYDLDDPGYAPVDGNAYRYRINFYAYAVNANGIQISPYYYFNVRLSCTKTAFGYQFVNDVSGDNQVGLGSIPLTWNMK